MVQNRTRVGPECGFFVPMESLQLETFADRVHAVSQVRETWLE